ncbi:MAG: thiamine-phosphate kinase [Candidatus Bathyarchaeota archaeon]|nr:thiamine-phosphate kinase [Candidatus Bathyarchaeota archaeon]
MSVGKSGRASVAVLGEHEIIEIIRRRLELMPDSPVSFGDDVSAVGLGGKRLAVLKTDMLVGKTDVPSGMSLWQAARKSIVMNVSDFASKGVSPVAVLVALGLPRDLTRQDIEQIADGLNAGAREYGAYVVGGDTNEASDLVVSVSLFGSTEQGKLMLRSGACPGDVLAVTGSFGKSAAGLRLLLDERCSAPNELREGLLQAVYMPKARLPEGLALGQCGAVSASIDSSDGLAWSLHEIARMSNVGFALDRVPMAEEVFRFAELNGFDALDLALYGGEEYELVVTVKANLCAKAAAAVEAVGGCLLPIGKVTGERGIFFHVGGEKRLIEARGWEHFKSEV